MNSFEELNKSICRLCLRFENSKNMVSLIDNTKEDGLSCYAKGVSNFTKVVIKKLDPLPKLVCPNCLRLLKQAIYFKLQCEHSDKLFQNIACGHSGNKDIKQAIAEFAMLNFYLDYQYSFSSAVKEKDKCKRNKSYILNDSDNNIEDNLQYDTGSPNNINSLYSENIAQDDNLIKDSNIVDSKVINVPIENDANYIIVKPLQSSRNTREKQNKCEDNLLNVLEQMFVPKAHDKPIPTPSRVKRPRQQLKKNDAQEHNLLNMLEEMFVPEEYDVPITIPSQVKLAMQPHKKLKYASTSSNTQADYYIKKMEDIFGTSSRDVEPANNIVSPRRTRMRLKRRTGLSNHSQSKSKQNLICNVCGKVLANQHTYSHHMQRHNGCRYICEHCGKGFPVLKELQIHQVCRHGTGPYLQCSQCSFKAPRKLDLMEHERIHSGERPYTCDKCGLTFRRRGIWRKHMIYHTEKKVQCPQCNKKFFQRSDMLAHANNVHDRVYVYLCSKCGATYAKGSTVRRHMTERHGIPREAQGKVIRINKMTGYQERRKR